MIYETLKRQGRLDVFKKYREPKDRSRKAQPQELLGR